jgi:nitroimidazol reductase NimA-like FMN-containing flavoprotein (pyridoxamine 5'-phosphate oxidase superfamily)
MASMPRTRITRLAEYAISDRHVLDALLDTARVCHVGLVDDGWPVVVPTAVARDGDRVLLHGSTGSRWMRTLAEGAPACVTVTAVDGIVVARSAFESSMHYRSAVIFGTATPVEDPERSRLLDVLTDTLLPGRTTEIRSPSGREMAATLLLAIPIEHWSLKVSHDWPDDPDSDVAGPAWAGVVPMRTTYDDPRPAPDLRPGIDVPPSVHRLRG